MATYTENRLINLNSQNATPKNGDFLSSVYFQFNGLLKDDSSIQAVYISIQNAQFPYSFYNINIYNNLLRLSVNGNPAVVLTLTRGNYNANTLITEIQSQLTSAAITDITITISSITGLLTFTKASGTFTLFSSGSTCFKVLGFNPTLDYTSVTSVLIAPYPLNLLGTLKLRIASYSLPTSSLDSSVGGNLNVLASIPINSGNFGLIMYENTNNIQSTLELKVLDNFDLEILDDDGNLVNFNGAYWTLTMLMSIEKRAKPISTGTFASAISSLQQAEAEPEPEPEPETTNIGEEEQELYVEAPDLEETVPADDLDLLLYGAGVR